MFINSIFFFLHSSLRVKNLLMRKTKYYISTSVCIFLFFFFFLQSNQFLTIIAVKFYMTFGPYSFYKTNIKTLTIK